MIRLLLTLCLILLCTTSMAHAAHVTINNTIFDVDVADDDAERTRGLMFRLSMPDNVGMLFVFNPPVVRPRFWMKNTYIPLDMIFIGADNKIVYIEHAAAPRTLWPRGPDAATPISYVLEINGGLSRTHNLRVGDVVVGPIPHHP